MQLFHHVNTVRISPVALEQGERRTTLPLFQLHLQLLPPLEGNHKEPHVQPRRNREKVKTDSDWSKNEERKVNIFNMANINTKRLPKREQAFSVNKGRNLKNFKSLAFTPELNPLDKLLLVK